jgi:lipoate---protein ligase
MRLLLHTAKSPAEDLALEEAIHLAVEEGASPNTWRLWQAAEPAVILGTGQEAAKEANLQVAKDERVRVLRRHSGGGAVVIGPGTINFSAFYRYADLPGSDTIRGAMSAVLAPVIKLLSAWKMDAREAGLSDLTVLGSDGTLRKLAGNSQARKKHSVVVHGTLLADPDWARLARLLPFPSSTPDYRAGRDHRSFLTSLREYGAPHDLESFTEGLRAALPSGIYISRQPDAEELGSAEKCLMEKYGSDAWNFRR